MWEWYNNGKRNKRILIGKKPPKGYCKGYIIVKDKIKRIRKLNEQYDIRKQRIRQQFANRLEKRLQLLDDELLKKQKAIIDF